MTWEEALAEFDRDLAAQMAAERTRRAYAVDLGQLSEWAAARGLDPVDIRHRDVRRYGAGLSAERAAPATVARKLAAIRSFYGFLVRTERVAQNPADLVASPKRASKAAEGVVARAGGGTAGPDSRPYPAGVARPGDVRARLLVRPAL